ncbi:hypothetical protein B0H63DRAFT_519844 [Podospora didyma]|uniref:Uncharacterized protein n=1 Tax=Podospora didyma TaxID=330526 RepID=A0AAE0NZF0_9PEZI|nr:hypothetical protein B0H63DRAFT_519844 [Podospora didyma]
MDPFSTPGSAGDGPSRGIPFRGGPAGGDGSPTPAPTAVPNNRPSQLCTPYAINMAFLHAQIATATACFSHPTEVCRNVADTFNRLFWLVDGGITTLSSLPPWSEILAATDAIHDGGLRLRKIEEYMAIKKWPKAVHIAYYLHGVAWNIRMYTTSNGQDGSIRSDTVPDWGPLHEQVGAYARSREDCNHPTANRHCYDAPMHMPLTLRGPGAVDPDSGGQDEGEFTFNDFLAWGRHVSRYGRETGLTNIHHYLAWRENGGEERMLTPVVSFRRR